MTIRSKFLFILIGDDMTGKTTLQKLLIDKICLLGIYDKLKCNLGFEITHPEIKRKYQRISFANRSYQEKKKDYGTVEEYFNNHFNPQDISFISSHLVESDIKEMILQGHYKFYNVFGVFFTNSIDSNLSSNALISSLNWDERLIVNNPIISNDDQEQIKNQLDIVAQSIVEFIINRTSIS
jgi:hypothetical protein